MSSRSTIQRSYDASPGRLYEAILRTVAELGYSIEQKDHSARVISFKAGRSFSVWAGQNMRAKVVEEAGGKALIIIGGTRGNQLYDWGEGHRIAEKVLSALESTLMSFPEPPVHKFLVTTSSIDVLERMAKLHASGHLSEEEFQTAKASLLNSRGQDNNPAANTYRGYPYVAYDTGDVQIRLTSGEWRTFSSVEHLTDWVDKLDTAASQQTHLTVNSATKQGTGTSRGMQIAVLIISICLVAIVGLQSCAVYVAGQLGSDKATAGGGAVGLLVAFLFLLGAAFVLGMPLLSVAVFSLAAFFSFAAASASDFSDMKIWGIVSIVLAAMSFMGAQSAKRRP